MPDKEELRELDAEVAERVMGFRWYNCEAGTGVERNQLCTAEQADIWREVGWTLTEIPGPPPPDQFNDDSAMRCYSSSIEAAMEVVERMWELGWQVEIVNCNKPNTLADDKIKIWYVQFINIDNDMETWAEEGDSLPEVISRAAMKATDHAPDTKG